MATDPLQLERRPILAATSNFLAEKVIDIPATGPPKIDPFEALIPPPKTVLGYNVYQTDTKFRKAVDGGIAQIHVTQTEGLYKLPPPGYVFPEDVVPKDENFGVEFCTRGPVLWRFVDEIMWDKIQLKQKFYKKRLRLLRRQNVIFEGLRMVKEHAKLVGLVGPAWFQELSNQQMRTVEKLKSCIIKDKKRNTIINTQENIGELGLVKLPRGVHIKLALDNCCECPVEFLLILYQLMNGKRKQYSLNDRLLLSGVAHLTMRATLKELHIRIPSPPLPACRPKRKPRPKVYRKVEYESPYLEPFTFEPCPRKHKGIYKNRHIQYPENPYFSYIPELKKETNFASDIDREIYLQKIQSGITFEQHQEITDELKIAEEKYNDLTDSDTVPYLLKASLHIPCDLFVVSSDEEEEEADDTCICAPDSNEVICNCNLGIPPSPCGEPVFVQNEINVYADPCRSSSSSSVVVTDCRCTTPATVVDPCERKEKITTVENIPRKPKIVSTECNCKELAEEFIQKASCQCKFCVQYRGAIDPCGLDDIMSCKEDAISRSVDEKCKCECLEKYKAHLMLYEKIKERFTAQQNLTSLPDQYVVGGVSRGPDGGTVYMLSGVVPLCECSCRKKYEEQLKEQERLANMPIVPEGKQKYEVCGVHPTGQGNVYVLSGALDKEACPCQKLYKSYAQRHSTCLETFDKYVKKVETDVEEYIQDIENDCRYDMSLKSSSSIVLPPRKSILNAECSDCSDDDCKPPTPSCKPPTSCAPLPCTCCSPPLCFPQPMCDSPPLPTCCSPPPTTCASPPPSCCNLPSPTCVGSHPCSCACHPLPTCASPPPCTCSCFPSPMCASPPPLMCASPPPLTCASPPLCTCSCAAPRTCEEVEEQENLCSCLGVPICYCEDDVGEEEEEKEPSLRRYTILDKIPCQYKEQMEIIKNSLAIMAEDGFPLAKLPDSWRLPIFKLWMQLRCGKYWTRDTREGFLKFSKLHWHHVSQCPMKMYQNAFLGMPAREARKYTRRHTERVQKMVSKKETCYYREMKHHCINHAREFYPTTVSYEWYTPSFRDCYFAYLPCKEASCDYFKPWRRDEVRGMCEKRCIC